MWNRSAAKKPRTLVAERAYFGFDPEAFRNGVQRLVTRVDRASDDAPVTASNLCSDFGVGASQAEVLLNAFADGGLLRADKRGDYHVTDRLRNYATARVVAPLRRARARVLINEAAGRASRINAEWRRNPLFIEAIAVSGGYMSRHDKLTEITLWLIVRPRPNVKTRRPRYSGGDLSARRQIITAMCALSSFVIVHVVTDKEAVKRPFSVVYQAHDDDLTETPRWLRWRDWTLSLSRRLGGRQRKAS